MDENQAMGSSQLEDLCPIDRAIENESSWLAKPSETIMDPHCFGLQELSGAIELRAYVSKIIQRCKEKSSEHLDPSSPLGVSPSTIEGPLPPKDVDRHPDLSYGSPLFVHLSHGLAYTVGSALGTTPPSLETCLAAYLVPNSVGLTAGARAWSKHCHRSQPTVPISDCGADKDKRKRSTKPPGGWWGKASGPQASINANALTLFHKIMDNATWRNLHWLPHYVLVYEVRVAEGYGMRWSQDQSDRREGIFGVSNDTTANSKEGHPWIFRGFLEPTMENGHELKWRHPLSE